MGSTRPRRYESPIRRKQVAETRQRIVAAGSALVHEMSSWDWRELTFRAVAERAGVGERTVYRHFPTEHHLRDAVMQRLNEEAGVDYEQVALADLGELSTRIFRSLSSFAARPSVREPDDPTFRAIDDQRRDALLAAVEQSTPDWTGDQRASVAAVLDVLWNLPTYERLVSAWGLDPRHATEAVAWAIDLVVAAVEADEPPDHRR